MPFIFGLVARDSTVLAHYSSASGNFKNIAVSLLSKASFDGKKLAFDQGEYVFSMLSEASRAVFMILTTKDVAANVRYYALDQIKSKFYSKYLNFSTFGEDSKTSEFAPEIEQIFNTLNSPTSAKIAEINRNITQAQEVMTQNLEAALARSEKLEVMEMKASKVKDSASAFQREARDLNRAACWEHYKWYIVGGGVGLLIIILLFLL